jgi:hypothetical protein
MKIILNDILKSKILERKEDLLDDYNFLYHVIEDLEDNMIEYVNDEIYNNLLQFYEIKKYLKQEIMNHVEILLDNKILINDFKKLHDKYNPYPIKEKYDKLFNKVSKQLV